MIQYTFPIKNTQNFQTIVSNLESSLNALLHQTNPLPTSLTYINGSLGLSSSSDSSTLYVDFYQSDTEYQLKNNSGSGLVWCNNALRLDSRFETIV